MPFFNDVRFVIQPDRKGNSDLITSIGFSELCSDEFIEAVKPEEWGYKENNGLLTDVMVLKENGLDVSCINLSCGYYNAHSDQEITVKKDLMKGLLFVEHIIEDCTAAYPHTGIFNDRYECEDEIHDILRQDPTLTPEDLQYMYATNFPALEAGRLRKDLPRLPDIVGGKRTRQGTSLTHIYRTIQPLRTATGIIQAYWIYPFWL